MEPNSIINYQNIINLAFARGKMMAPAPLLALPTAIHHYGIFPQVDTSSVARFAASSQTANELAKPSLATRKFLKCLAKGELVQAREIIEKNNQSLFLQALQYATLTNEIYNLDSFSHFINPISAHENEPYLKQFEQLQFNTQLLVDALTLYDKNYDEFGKNRPNDPYYSAKNIVCWRKIIGYIQRFVPACLAQAIHQGVYYIVHDKEKLQRLTEFRFDKPHKLFPLDSDPTCLPGYDYAGRCLGGRRRGAGAAGRGWWGGAGDFFKTYVKQKHQHCKAMQHPGNQSKHIQTIR